MTAFSTAKQFVTTTKWFATTPQEFGSIPKGFVSAAQRLSRILGFLSASASLNLVSVNVVSLLSAAQLHSAARLTPGAARAYPPRSGFDVSQSQLCFIIDVST